MRWSKEDDLFLKESYNIIGAKECALKLERSLSSIYSRATTLKIQQKIQFTKCADIPKRIINQIRVHAKSKGRKCLIDEKDIYEIWIIQNKKCALSGMNIQFHNNIKLSTASVDRIDSSGDYTRDNIQIVHKDINLSKRIYSDDYYIHLCKHVAYNNQHKKFHQKIEWVDDLWNDTIIPIKVI